MSLINLSDYIGENNIQSVIHLLSNGADVNMRNCDGTVAINTACEHNHTAILSILLNHPNININITNIYGSSAIFTCCGVSSSYESLLLLLSDARTDINLTDKWGWTCLMMACYYDNIKHIKLLLAYGRFVDVQKKTKLEFGGWCVIWEGSTVADFAIEINNREVITLIQNYILDPLDTQKRLRDELNLKGPTNKTKKQKQKQNDLPTHSNLK